MSRIAVLAATTVVALLFPTSALCSFASSYRVDRNAGAWRELQPDWLRTLHWWVASGGGDQGQPPTALAPYLPRFLHLYASYQTLQSVKKPTFAQWLILHGVIEPTAHQAMLLLYQWAQRQG